MERRLPITHKITQFSLRLALPVLIVAIYWYQTRGNQSVFFPSVTAIASAFRQNWLFAGVVPQVLPTLKRMYEGYVLGGMTAIAVGLLLGLTPSVRVAINPLIQLVRATPGPVVILVFLAAFGVGDSSKIALVALVCFFPVLLNVIDGVRSREPVLEDLSQAFHLSWHQRLFKVILPGAAPQIAAGLRVALPLAFGVTVASEFLAGSNGIGYVTFQDGAGLAMADMWSGIVLLALLGWASNLLFTVLERWALRWHFSARQLETRTQRGNG